MGRDFSARLAAYGGPVRLVNGEDDRINRPATIERNAEIADRGVFVRGAGHTVNLERPDAYTTVVREFVTNQWGFLIRWNRTLNPSSPEDRSDGYRTDSGTAVVAWTSRGGSLPSSRRQRSARVFIPSIIPRSMMKCGSSYVR